MYCTFTEFFGEFKLNKKITTNKAIVVKYKKIGIITILTIIITTITTSAAVTYEPTRIIAKNVSEPADSPISANKWNEVETVFSSNEEQENIAIVGYCRHITFNKTENTEKPPYTDGNGYPLYTENEPFYVLEDRENKNCNIRIITTTLTENLNQYKNKFIVVNGNYKLWTAALDHKTPKSAIIVAIILTATTVGIGYWIFRKMAPS